MKNQKQNMYNQCRLNLVEVLELILHLLIFIIMIFKDKSLFITLDHYY